MHPKVSICIPTHNRKDYLRQAIDSALAQTYGYCEIVVVDDGSTDGTKEMMDAVGSGVRYHWMDHGGQSAARNKLIDLARGRFITFLDSDDLLFPGAVQSLVNAMDTHGPDVFVYGSYVGMDENGSYTQRKRRKLPSGMIATELFDFIHVHTCGTLCAKRLYEEFGGFDISLRRCAAYKLLLDISLKYEFVGLDEVLYARRRHSGNRFDHSCADRKIELEVLEDFYYNRGGKDIIREHRAMKRFGQEAYRAGRCAIREGRYEEARQLLRDSFRRYPNVKSAAGWFRAALGRLKAVCRPSQTRSS